jgi:sugar lactone lactonase YvrE
MDVPVEHRHRMPDEMPAAATLSIDSRCTLGEGPTWWAARGALLWTDIQASRLWMHTPAGSTRSWNLPDRLGSMAVCGSGALLLGLAKGLFLAAPDEDVRDLAVTPVVPVEPELPSTRINDGRTDRSGNFVFGTMDEAEAAPIGGFYQYSAASGLKRLDLPAVTIANSICFSLDGKTMYFCDSPGRQILQCDYDAALARAANVRTFVRFAAHQGLPDGSVVDADGCLWNAEWGAGVVRRYTPSGRLDREVPVPAKNPTCPCFGGAALDDIYITSARQAMTPQELERTPQAGGVYRASVGVRGIPDLLFEGH